MGDAIPGAPVSLHDVRVYRETHFAKLKPSETPKWESPITVAVSEDEASAYNASAPAFRRISMDVMVFAFSQELQHRLDLFDSAGLVPLGFLQAARHVPVNYVLVPASAAHEEHVYLLSLQIMEDFRIAEEVHAPRAWQLCQLWAQARDMKQKAGAAAEDSASAVAEMLKRIRCSKNCEYADKGTIMKRVIQDALNVYDRVVAAEAGDLLERAGAEFGSRSPLTSMSKLVKLSQAVQGAASSRKSNAVSLLRRTIHVMFLRLQLSLTDSQEGLAALGKTEIPRCILIAELLPEAASCLSSDGQPQSVQDVLLSLTASLPRPSAVEAAAREALHPSTKAGLSWVVKVLMGNLDGVLREMVHQDIKKTSAKQLLQHGKLNWSDDVQPKLESEAEAHKRKAVAAAVASRGIPDEDGLADALVQLVASPGSSTAPALADDFGGTSAAAAALEVIPAGKSEEPQPTKSPLEARAAHAKAALDGFLQVDVCPALDAGVGDWQVILEKLNTGCFEVSRDGFQLHAWVLDAASDAEPTLQDGESVFARAPVVSKVLAERFFKAAGRNTGAERHFTLLAPARGEGASGVLNKIMTEAPFEEAVADHLNILYKEISKGRGQRKSRTKLLERVFGFVSKAAAAAAANAPLKRCNRLHFTATSTMSDSVLNAPMPAEEHHQPRLTLERKVHILSPGGLLRGEDPEKSPSDECVLLHHEKAPELWEEVFHHYRVSTIATATPGSGTMLKAAIRMQIRAAALCKNEEHKAFLLEQLLEWAIGESRRATSWCFVTDADLGVKPAEGGSIGESESGSEQDEEQEEEAASPEEDSEASSEEEESPAAKKSATRGAAKAAAKAAAAGLKAMAAEAKKKAKAEAAKKGQDLEDAGGEAAAEELPAAAAKKLGGAPRRSRPGSASGLQTPHCATGGHSGCLAGGHTPERPPLHLPCGAKCSGGYS